MDVATPPRASSTSTLAAPAPVTMSAEKASASPVLGAINENAVDGRCAAVPASPAPVPPAVCAAEPPASTVGAWLFEGGADGGALRSMRTKSKVLEALKEILEQHEEQQQEERRPWIKSTQADIIFGIVIALYAVVTGIDVQVAVKPIAVSQGFETAMFVTQVIFTLIFIVELSLRIKADGLRFCSPLHSPAGFFDAIIILLGAVELIVSVFHSSNALKGLGVMRIFRLLRLFRILRVLMVCKELKLLFVGLLSSVRTVFWAFVLMLVLMYLGTLVCVILLGNDGSMVEYFGSVPLGLYTHFQIVTLEAWPDIADAAIKASGSGWAVYFMVFISMTSMAVMNLVTGVVCDKLMGANTETSEDIKEEGDQLAAYTTEVERCRGELANILRKCREVAAPPRLRAEEVAALMRRHDFRQLLESMDITTELDAESMYEIIARNCGNEGLDDEALLAGLLRLRGSRDSVHSAMLQKDIIRGSKIQASLAAELGLQLRQRCGAELRGSRLALLRELEDLDADLSELRAFPDALAAAAASADAAEGAGATDAGACVDRSTARAGASSASLRAADAAVRLERLLPELDALHAAANHALGIAACDATAAQDGSDDGDDQATKPIMVTQETQTEL
eukprot:TRINITY_DN63929_c0_g1_i1.p1 TRINITY_DN63929_c0_g1~~TRINITY_DN63929_c0_g1_i1.p1  ORF type:complete len:655 (+),score=185.29 TRINITY_DN63929_c0_g1_i1:93-1967(+)